MNDDAFARLVAEDVKNKSTPQQQAYLNLPENWIRWQKALALLSENLVKQIAGIHEFEREKLKEYESLGDEGVRVEATWRRTWRRFEGNYSSVTFFLHRHGASRREPPTRTSA